MISGAISAQSFTPVPGNITRAADITPDGQTIVGTGIDPASGNLNAYYWRWKTGPAPTFIGGTTGNGISDDGSVVTGIMKDPATGVSVAGRWTQATGWVALGGFTVCTSLSSGYDVAGDGENLVGLAWNSCSAVGYLYDSVNGMRSLESLWNGGNRASRVSADGSVAVGFAQGNFSRTPAYWNTSTLLGTVPNPDDGGEYYGVSVDGSILLGGRNGDAFFEEWDNFQSAYVATSIGGLNPGWASYAVSVSESGGTIAGIDTLGLGSEAWVWNPASGLVSLQNRLTSLGVVGVPYLGTARAITPDGTIIVGDTVFQGAWIAEVPPGPIAKPYGCGFNNPPGSLTHTAGASSIGSVIQFGVDDPTGTMVAPAFGFVSYALQPAPNFPCGIPLPGFAMFGPTADLLISLAPPNPIMQQTAAALWSTPGQPVTVDFPIPFDIGLYGIDLYAQGALFSPSTAKIGLTNGQKFTIGLF